PWQSTRWPAPPPAPIMPAFPEALAMSRYDDDEPARPSGSGTPVGLIIGIVLGVVVLIAVGIVALLALLLIPAVSKVRTAAERAQPSPTRRQRARGAPITPPAPRGSPPPHPKTKDGRPGRGRRVLPLPTTGQDNLSRQFKLDEPWDSPNNAQ